MERGLFPQTWDLSGVGCLISRLLEDSNKHSVPVRPDANSVCWCSELWEALGIVGNSREEARKGRGVRSRLPVPLLPFSCGITAPKRGCAFRLKEVKVPTYWTDLMAYKETGQSQANWCLEEDHGLSHQWGQHLQMATTLTIWKSDWVTLWQSHLTLEESFNSSLSNLSRFSNGNPKRITMRIKWNNDDKAPCSLEVLSRHLFVPFGSFPVQTHSMCPPSASCL